MREIAAMLASAATTTLAVQTFLVLVVQHAATAPAPLLNAEEVSDTKAVVSYTACSESPTFLLHLRDVSILFLSPSKRPMLRFK